MNTTGDSFIFLSALSLSIRAYCQLTSRGVIVPMAATLSGSSADATCDSTTLSSTRGCSIPAFNDIRIIKTIAWFSRGYNMSCTRDTTSK